MMLLRSWEDNADKSSQVKILFNMYGNIDQKHGSIFLVTLFLDYLLVAYLTAANLGPSI